MAKDVKFNIKLTIDGKQVVVQCKNDVRALGEALTGVSAKARKADAVLSRLTSVSTLLRNGLSGFQQLGSAMQPYINKANAAATAQTKLTTVMRQRMNATEADVAAVNKMVGAQTQLGIVGGTVQRSGLQQLATFSSQRDTLETLLPAMNNLLAQQKGLNATSEDAVGVANLMGKALMGNVGALTRVGITLTDQQKELIKTGDEYTRAKTLAQAITDNVGNMNAELAKTDAGQVKKAQMAFASLETSVGKMLAPLQGVMTQFAQIGLAVGGIGQLYTAINGLVRAVGLTSAVTSIWHARTVMSTAATNLFTAALNGASVGATTLKFALRGLMSATVVGAAITLLGVGLEKLISYFTSASGASKQLKQSVADTSKTLDQQRDQALAPTLAKYQELQTKWKSLKSEHEKNEFIKANKTAFEQLGVSIDGVGKAEDFFVRNTKAVQDAMYARAEAAAAASMAEEEMRKALEAESKVKRDRQMDKDSYKKQHHTGKTGQDAALDALVDSGAIGVTSKRTQRDVADMRSHQANAKAYTNRAASATVKANAGLKPYQATPTSTPTSGKIGGKTGNASTSGTEKNADLGSLDWYEQEMQKLRKQIYATNNEQTAQGLQAQYDDLEQKSKSLKVAIGLEDPDTKEVKTYVEQLQEKLAAAQKDMDNATTVEARVSASAKVDEIQAEIDKATKGEVSIKADVEPSYMVKGSVADKRQSYSNAQSKGSTVQSDFEIGIIGKDEAERQIAEINKEIAALGANMKPIKLQVDDKSVEALKNLGSVDIKSFESVRQAIKGIQSIAGPTAKGLAGVGTACSSLGSAMQQLGSDSAAAKVGMVMAAIGQIVLSFAQALQSASSNWVTWLAFGIAGTATMISLISTIQGFSTGGVVSGSSTTGDKIPIRVNSGEMILTKTQQARLFAIANGATLPQRETVRPQVGSLGDSSLSLQVSVGGRLRGTDMELIGKNTRSLGAKIGKRY